MERSNYIENYNIWLEKGLVSPIKDNSIIREYFDGQLTFGTGGIRATMGPGTNKLNTYTVRKFAQGYADYVNSHMGNQDGIVIAYDNRKKSKIFAKEIAQVLSINKIKTYLFDNLRPTPELSFAVIQLKCFGGVVITASHNPPEYNGIKTYNSNGVQSIPSETNKISEHINKIKNIFDIQLDKQMENVITIGKDIDKLYYENLISVQFNPCDNKHIKIIYTPLHGTGLKPVTTLLKKLNYDVEIVESQSEPDENFSNTESPNPEDKASFNEAIKVARKNNADIIIATDPDCDRIGVVCNNHYFTGNQIGAIMLDYILHALKSQNKLNKESIMFDSIVSSCLCQKIAKHYNVETESTLTGFKYIGEKIQQCEGKKHFVFAYEESCGYLIKDFVRDKDGVQATILICEICQYYKNKGLSLIDALNQIYDKYGHYEDKLITKTSSKNTINSIMEKYRNNTSGVINNKKYIIKEDYLLQTKTQYDSNGNITKTTTLNLPKSNVIKFFMPDGSFFVVRPSGNEPKIKYYYCDLIK